ncbi:MAG: decaprenyl-phosphate phosphoribosyltransferase [Candidatus Handelsmanbacteria bacterium]|nr:decaprenyl-phosphate phosphoribosyltransferase [Candidatus Handelsmanbacteria bacterium]
MLYQLLRSTRPQQWIKNLFVLPALFFSGHALEPDFALRALAGALCFCLLSGAVYLCNDILDLPQDRLHPEKSRRPLAAGLVPVRLAATTAVLLFAGSLAAAFWLHPPFGGVVLVYALLNLAYSFKLKQVVLIDVLIVAAGFLLRALGGALVIAVSISTWFILCIFTLALFLAVVKRRQELVALAQRAGQHRATLGQYGLAFLDQLIAVLTTSALVCYALYATGVGDSQTGAHMQWTIPFVLYGLLRYLYVVYHMGGGANPTALVWKDRPLQLTLALWGLACAAGIYGLP